MVARETFERYEGDMEIGANREFAVVRRDDGRYILVDPSTGEIIHDAQGYGFRTDETAKKAGWYNFMGGKSRLDAFKAEGERFWLDNDEFRWRVVEVAMRRFKRYADRLHGEATYLSREMGIVGYHPGFLKFLSTSVVDQAKVIFTRPAIKIYDNGTNGVPIAEPVRSMPSRSASILEDMVDTVDGITFTFSDIYDGGNGKRRKMNMGRLVRDVLKELRRTTEERDRLAKIVGGHHGGK